jgi:MFS family permease
LPGVDADADGVTGNAAGVPATVSGSGRSPVLLILASAQFLMTLDSSVMNVSIRSVAADLGTTVTGIQTAITLYTLVMAAFMITGGKIGALIGRRRAFGIGLVVYGCGSLVTSIAPNLTVLIIGWSLLEGLGAALIMPAIVALVAGNVAREGRSAAYGLIAAAGAIAVAAGPLIGGAVTTFASWRWVFVGEVVIVGVILAFLRTIHDTPPEERVAFDGFGAALSVVGLATTVYGVLRSGTWGWVHPKPGAPTVAGVSLVFWLIVVGLLVLGILIEWEVHREKTGREPLFRPSMFANRQMTGGLVMFGFQFFIQSGVFFTIPLFLSVVLELNALQTGLRLLPLSLALLASALAVPRLWPGASPRRVVRLGLLSMLVGTLLLVGGLDPGATAAIVLVPMALMGLGIGALASQLGAVTVSAFPDSLSAEVGGLQNTFTNFGASLGTALVGAVLIGSLTTTFLTGVSHNSAIPPEVVSHATVELEAGIPFISDADLRKGLATTSLPPPAQDAIVAENASARLVGLRTALSVVALVIVIALFLARMLPATPVGADPPDGADDASEQGGHPERDDTVA